MNRLTVSTVLLCSLTTPSVAQTVTGAQRHGFWLAGGVGGGSARVSCDSCGNYSGRGGVSYSIALGATPNMHLRVGAEWRYWVRYVDTVPLIQTYTALASYYPRPRGGPFVEAGLGLARYSASVHTILYVGNGFGTSVCTGWELPFRSGFSLRPQVSYLIGAVGTLRTSSGTLVATGWKQRLLLAEIRFQI
jgi:hypothetical protein